MSLDQTIGGAYIQNNSIFKVDFYNPGEYLVALFKDNNYAGDCEVLTSSADLSTHDIGRCWYWDSDCPSTTILGITYHPPCFRSCVSSFKIIPIKAAASAATLPPPPPPPLPWCTCSIDPTLGCMGVVDQQSPDCNNPTCDMDTCTCTCQ